MHETMKKQSEKSFWTTSITRVSTNHIEIAGYPLNEITGLKSLPEAAYLLFNGTFPEPQQVLRLKRIVHEALGPPCPAVKPTGKEDVSKTLVRILLSDDALTRYPDEGPEGPCGKTMFSLGRMFRYLGFLLQAEDVLHSWDTNEPFSHLLHRLFFQNPDVKKEQARMLEALTVAAVDHGVTAPSAQASILAASVRAPYEVALAQGISTLTDVHGGACAGAAEFFLDSVRQAEENGTDPAAALQQRIREHLQEGSRIPGLGHRIHTDDPRCRSLWVIAEKTGIAGECVRCSKILADVFETLRGFRIPVNVDGVIGAVVADLGLQPVLAKAVFILGRLCGISTHYFEEKACFPKMRWINFDEAVYQGHPPRPLPGGC